MPRLLIVEDDLFQRELFAAEFADDGYEVCTASNGFEALDFLKREAVDCVIMDVRMPRMDGIELLGRLQGLKRKVPVIVYTAYSETGSSMASWTADALITKSVSMEPLKGKVSEILHDADQSFNLTTVTPSPPSPFSPGLKSAE